MERKRTRVSLVRQKSRVSSILATSSAVTPPRARAGTGSSVAHVNLTRKLSRKLDISFDKLDNSAFPFQFLNTTVSVGVTM